MEFSGLISLMFSNFCVVVSVFIIKAVVFPSDPYSLVLNYGDQLKVHVCLDLVWWAELRDFTPPFVGDFFRCWDRDYSGIF